MFGIAARRMGYRVHAFEPNPDSPAGQISDVEINASYTDARALKRFARRVNVISFEFENIPLSAIKEVASLRPLRPRGEVLHICQNREREKEFLVRHGFPRSLRRGGLFRESECSAKRDRHAIGAEDRRFRIRWKRSIEARRCRRFRKSLEGFQRLARVLGKWISFQGELSVIVARGLDGSMVPFPPSENLHKHHILDLSIVPARFPPALCEAAVQLASEIADSLDVVGLLAVEFF